MLRLRAEHTVSPGLRLSGEIDAPYYARRDREEWTESGTLAQTDDLRNLPLRIGGYARASPLFFLPAVGLHYSHAWQIRDRFWPPGVFLGGRSVEQVRSVAAALVWSGVFGHEIRFRYEAEYLAPLWVSVTNSVLPGFEVNDAGGWAYRVRLGLEAHPEAGPSYGVEGGIGRVHWDGSDWVPLSGGREAKWPENDLSERSAAVTLRWGW